MIILIVIGIIFFRRAQGTTSNKVMWAIIGPIAYYLFQFIGVFIVGLINLRLLEETAVVFIVGLLSGITGVAIAYRIMDKQNPTANKSHTNSDLIDDNL